MAKRAQGDLTERAQLAYMQLRQATGQIYKNILSAGVLALKKLPVADLQVKCLTVAQIHALLLHSPTEIWRMRIIISLCTGLRADDIDRLTCEAVRLDEMLLDIAERKTGKGGAVPLPDITRGLLAEYLAVRGCGPLFPDRNVQRTWENIRRAAGFVELDEAGNVVEWRVTRQHFRQTHASLIGITEGLRAAQTALQHSSAAVTQSHYTDMSLLRRVRVNQLPVTEWLAELTNP